VNAVDEDLPPVEELTAEEGRVLFDEVCRRELGISGAEFLAGWDAGRYECDGEQENHLKVTKVAMLIPFARQ
jgi:hypothetical protein